MQKALLLPEYNPWMQPLTLWLPPCIATSKTPSMHAFYDFLLPYSPLLTAFLTKKKKKSFPYQLLQCIFMLAVQLINKATDKPIAFYRILHHFLHCFSNSKKHFIFWLLENKAPKKNTKNNYKEVLDCLI